MDRRTFIKSTGVSISALGPVGSASGEDRYRPGGPWAPDENAINYESLLDNDELVERLHGIEQRSDRVELEEIGRSSERNDPIWEVTLGDGDESVHVINAIHGDEPAGVQAIVNVIERLARGSSPEVEGILDNLTLTIVPSANPDGNEFRGEDGLAEEDDRVQRRANTTEWEAGDSRHRPNYFADYLEVGGYDLNQDFSVVTDFEPIEDEDEDWWNGLSFDLPIDEIELEPTVDEIPDPFGNHGLRLNPETRAITDSYLAADPDWALTHHQGAPLDPDSADEPGPDWQTMMSVMAPQGPAYADVSDDVEEGGGTSSSARTRRNGRSSSVSSRRTRRRPAAAAGSTRSTATGTARSGVPTRRPCRPGPTPRRCSTRSPTRAATEDRRPWERRST